MSSHARQFYRMVTVFSADFRLLGKCKCSLKKGEALGELKKVARTVKRRINECEHDCYFGYDELTGQAKLRFHGFKECSQLPLKSENEAELENRLIDEYVDNINGDIKRPTIYYIEPLMEAFRKTSPTLHDMFLNDCRCPEDANQTLSSDQLYLKLIQYLQRSGLLEQPEFIEMFGQINREHIRILIQNKLPYGLSYLHRLKFSLDDIGTLRKYIKEQEELLACSSGNGGYLESIGMENATGAWDANHSAEKTFPLIPQLRAHIPLENLIYSVSKDYFRRKRDKGNGQKEE